MFPTPVCQKSGCIVLGPIKNWGMYFPHLYINSVGVFFQKLPLPSGWGGEKKRWKEKKNGSLDRGEI